MPNSTKLGHYLSAIVRTILNMPKQTQLRWGQNGVRESKHILSLQNFRWRNHYPRLSNVCQFGHMLLRFQRICIALVAFKARYFSEAKNFLQFYHIRQLKI